MVDAAVFKEGMRRLAGSVCVITTALEDERLGCTATAVCSLSDSPPSLLICLNKASQTAAAIGQTRRFAVNVLGTEDVPVAARFARSGPASEKFGTGEWTQSALHIPILASAPVSFSCNVADIVSSGSHNLIIGHIDAVDLGDGDPSHLLYANGAYGAFVPPPAGSPLERLLESLRS